jgi:hypothetical protein
MQMIAIIKSKTFSQKTMRRRVVSVFIPLSLFVLGCVSCTSAPVQRAALTAQEQFQEDIVSTRLWPEQLESVIRITGKVDNEVLLRKIALKVANADPFLAETPLGVRIFDEQPIAPHSPLQNLPQVISIPGNRVYISSKLLLSLDYENELAGLFAVEFSHLLARDAIQNHRQGQPVPELPMVASVPSTGHAELPLPISSIRGPNSLFRYQRAQDENAFRAAVKILYQAGYDPRGLVSYLRKRHNLEKEIPSTLVNLLETATREELSRIPPLRNPIVSTGEFIALTQRLKKK